MTNPWASKPQRWDGGLTWSRIDGNLILRKKPTKTLRSTGAEAVFDLRLYPLVMEQIARVPPEQRMGPMIISEKMKLPYTSNVFRDMWRAIATAAGVSKNVQNRDSRSGMVTESLDAGAELNDVRVHATHKNASMTLRYDRSTLLKTQRVAAARELHRKKDS